MDWKPIETARSFHRVPLEAIVSLIRLELTTEEEAVEDAVIWEGEHLS